MTLVDFVLANSSWLEVDCIQVTLPNGIILRGTSHQQDIIVNGDTFYATRYGKWERGPVMSELNTVTETDITLTAGADILFPGTSRPVLRLTKLFARAAVVIKTAVLDNSLVVIGSKTIFAGQIIQPNAESTHATFKCADYGYLGLKPWPTRVICAGCPHTLFDRGCTLDKGDFAVSVTLASGTTPLNAVVSSPLGSVGTDTLPYSRGFFVPTSGEASGWPITVANQIDSTHLELAPFALEASPGDTGTLFPGCDGQRSTCEFKFDNRHNFGGFPNVPGPAGAINATGS